MISTVIREYGLLSKATAAPFSGSLDQQQIPVSAWNWLLEQACGDGDYKPLVRPKKFNGQLHLQVLNYVGVITTPCGIQIEILPKHCNEIEVIKTRRILLKMLNRVCGLSMREFEQADLRLFKQPLSELLVHFFLGEVKQLIKRGLRSSYRGFRDETSYLRGRLQLDAQLRQTPGRQHYFQVLHDEFLPDRAENRLIHSALKCVLQWSQSSTTQQWVRELLVAFDGIPVSDHIHRDFECWQTDRTMQHYRMCKPWCEFILHDQLPYSLAGCDTGRSFLFPMNELFEKYVARILEKQLAQGFTLMEQVSTCYLIEAHESRPCFQLKPDLLILNENRASVVLDCKWKLLNKNNLARHRESRGYGVGQADLYQMFAYGKKYLDDGIGTVYLIYPKHSGFHQSLAHFQYDDRLFQLFDMFYLYPEDHKKSGLVFVAQVFYRQSKDVIYRAP